MKSSTSDRPSAFACSPTHPRMLPARRPQPAARRGVATVWLVLFLPLFLLMLCFVIESGNLWMARSELESALEAAALAAVKEWGDTSGGSTSTARQVGQSVAAANTVRGTSLVIGQNYTAGGANNENTNITFPPNTANLIFGALTSTSPTVVFCPTVTPSCGLGTVLLDASSNASMQADNAWGFNFQAPNITPNLTLSRVVLNLRAGGDPDAVFNFGANAPVISDNVGNIITTQNDVFGISNAALVASVAGTVTTWANTQVAFVFDSTLPYIVTINFSAFGGDIGLEPGDRIRFGASVNNLGANDGDDVGVAAVLATLTFAIAGVNQVPNQLATFFDSNFRGTNVPSTLDPDSAINTAPYLLPNSPANGNGNDNQSFVISSGAGGGNDFAVRAESIKVITPVCSSLFGAILGSFQVHAQTTAYYKCSTRCPSIIRVDTICP